MDILISGTSHHQKRHSQASATREFLEIAGTDVAVEPRIRKHIPDGPVLLRLLLADGIRAGSGTTRAAVLTMAPKTLLICELPTIANHRHD